MRRSSKKLLNIKVIIVDNTKLLDIVAYYLSEYDMDAVLKLGYVSRSEAFRKIGQCFGKNNNYLKRLRDEYDVVTSSSRRGQCNRPPRERIIKTTEHLKEFTFIELTEIVTSIITNILDEQLDARIESSLPVFDISAMDEEELERIINFKDNTAGIKITIAQRQQRVYKTGIIKQLKKLYRGNCQICAHRPFDEYKEDICEVHHIEYFSFSQNNNANNLIVVCPNHHRLIHKLNPEFDAESKSFVFSDGSRLKIHLDYHLSEE